MKSVKGKITLTQDELQRIYDESNSLEEYIDTVARLIQHRVDDDITGKLLVEYIERFTLKDDE